MDGSLVLGLLIPTAFQHLNQDHNPGISEFMNNAGFNKFLQIFSFSSSFPSSHDLYVHMILLSFTNVSFHRHHPDHGIKSHAFGAGEAGNVASSFTVTPRPRTFLLTYQLHLISYSHPPPRVLEWDFAGALFLTKSRLMQVMTSEFAYCNIRLLYGSCGEVDHQHQQRNFRSFLPIISDLYLTSHVDFRPRA